MPTKTRVFSPEHRAKLSAAKKGKVHSPETRAKIGAARKGRTHAPETRAKIGAASKGRTHTPEARAEIGAVHKGNTYRKGKKHSPETRAKMSALVRASRRDRSHPNTGQRLPLPQMPVPPSIRRAPIRFRRFAPKVPVIRVLCPVHFQK